MDENILPFMAVMVVCGLVASTSYKYYLVLKYSRRSVSNPTASIQAPPVRILCIVHRINISYLHHIGTPRFQ